MFTVGDEGRLSAQPAFMIAANGTITPAGDAVSDGQPALCWEIAARGFVYGGNAGGNDVSQHRVNPDGSITLVNAIAASGIPGAIDMAQTGGRFLYAESEVSSSVHAFSIGSDGSLNAIQTVTVPDGSSLEGIAAG